MLNEDLVAERIAIADKASGSNNINGVVCVFTAVGTPNRIVTNIDSTTAMMGRQKAESDDITYEWSYHPDSGLQLVMYDK